MVVGLFFPVNKLICFVYRKGEFFAIGVKNYWIKRKNGLLMLTICQ